MTPAPELATPPSVLRVAAWEGIAALRHGFSSRALGSLGLSAAPDPESVLRRRAVYARLVGFDWSRAVLAAQVHGTTVRRVDQPGGQGARTLLETDGLCTAERGVALVTFHADCFPVLLYDPERPAIAIAHAGWRGTLKGIIREAVRVLRQEFASRPQRLHAAIGPGICGACYQVGEDVARLFHGAGWARALRSRKGRLGSQLDLPAVLEQQLLLAGLDPQRIARDAALCTYEHPELLFSHRRRIPGRFMAAIALA